MNQVWLTVSKLNPQPSYGRRVYVMERSVVVSAIEAEAVLFSIGVKITSDALSAFLSGGTTRRLAVEHDGREYVFLAP